MARLFVPGWGGPRGLYAACVPDGWEILEPPPFRATGGDLAAYRRWLGDEIGAARAAAHARRPLDGRGALGVRRASTIRARSSVSS